MIDYSRYLNSTVKDIQPSGIRKFFDIVAEDKSAVSLGVGEPDFDTPWLGRNAAIKSIQKGFTQYSSNCGMPLLRELISDYYSSRFGVKYDPAHEIIVTVGASEAIDLALRAIIEPGDEVLVPDQSYVSYCPCVKLSGGVPVPVKCSADNGFILTPEHLLASVSDKTKAVILPYPNNPTGKLIDKELLTEIIAKCRKLNIKILIDECFMDFVADENAYSMIEKLQSNNNLIILKAFTKTYAMPGLRLGYCLTADTDLLLRLHECGQDWNVSVPAQEAGCAALDETAYVEKAKKLIAKERRYLTAALNRLGARTYGSEANYIFFKLEQPQDLKEQLLKKGFLIRSCANYHNLNGNYYRIAVKRHAVNIRFIKALKEVQNNALINGDN